MAERQARLITKRTSVPGKIPTGTTGSEASFIRSGELASNLADKKLWGYDGVDVFEYGSESFLGLTGGTINGDLFVTGNTIIESLTADTISSPSILKTKSGIVAGANFAGNPKKATITFSNSFDNNNYSITVTGEVSRSWSIESKSSSGFVINANANLIFTDNVFWQAIEVGETI